ncbi:MULTISPECIES: NUDIX hydrolase [Bacillaceae]|uniref:NUDIX hydrolase n=1 Tax=Evansella alkalicola TaxID=745819 RepID=A0ABS6JPT9_9BACI|nr:MULTISPECIES: NUDIX hydrolase [Bacillaceae]MBU9720579.1 NUDIX hydrolase [Bacillus alkalicola]
MSQSNWKVQQSDNIIVDRFHIQKEHIQSTSGEMDISFISFADGVCILAITNDNEVVISKKYRHAVKEWEWELPSGTIDQHEEPLAAAKRELAAETGFTADLWKSLGHFHPSASATSETIHLFFATALTKIESPATELDENTTLLKKWSEVMTLINEGEFKHGAGLAAILKYQLKQSN